MERVVIMGRGGAGKSTMAARLGVVTGLPVVELDKHFWQPDAPTPERWAAVQRDLVAAPTWIMDGDLGPYDSAVEVRLAAADTVILLDFSLLRCSWRALRRSRENAEFWRWVVHYRRRWRPLVRRAIAQHASGAEVYVLRTPRAVARFERRLRAT